MTDIEIPEGFTRWDETDAFQRVEVMFRNGEFATGQRCCWGWESTGGQYDIIAYRVLP